MTKFERETRHRLYIFIKKKQQLTRQNARQQRSVRLHSVNGPFNCSISLSNYKHDAFPDLSVLKSGW